VSIPDQLVITYIIVGIFLGCVSWIDFAEKRRGALTLNLMAGVAGAIGAPVLLPRVGLYIGGGFIAELINAAIGAVILLLVVRLVKR
jgi:uncharacterized membrane protein YeaQ/YmgE (transglycosylase-associated protein family)